MNHLGLENLTDPLKLAEDKVQRSMLASSYDRRGGNHDWSSYVRREGSAAIMMLADGPGCITRIWTADPQKGTVRIFLDHAEKPTIEMPFEQLFSLLPLTFGIGGESPENYARSKAEGLSMGYTSYCPIPFQKHCKITIDPEDDYLYFQLNWDQYMPGTAIRSFDPKTDLDTPQIRQVQALLDGWGQHKPMVDMSAVAPSEHAIQPGDFSELLFHDGPGVVRGLRLRLPAGLDTRALEHVKDNLWVVAHFDDDEPRDPSIRVPIGPFFLDYNQNPRPRSFLIGSEGEGDYYCFFAMPHEQNARIKLVNQGVLPIAVTASVLHDPWDAPKPGYRRFRATWHVEMPFGPDHRDYGGVACRLLNLDGRDNVEMLYARGAGHFVGAGFQVDLREAPTDRAAGEGDEMFFIDDDPRYTMYGTGTEDYVNDAWGCHGFVNPWCGDSIMGEWGDGPQIIGYRLHVADPVPFLRKGRFTLEHGTGNNCSGLYRSVAYWYMHPSIAQTKVEERHWENIGKAT